jgi:hypothetical protein
MTTKTKDVCSYRAFVCGALLVATLTAVASSISIASAQPGGGASEHAPIVPEGEECSAGAMQTILKDYSSNGQALSTADCERFNGVGDAGAAEMSRVPGWGSVWKCIKKMCGYADDVPKKPKVEPDFPDGPRKPKVDPDLPDGPQKPKKPTTDYPEFKGKKACKPDGDCSVAKSYCLNVLPDIPPDTYHAGKQRLCRHQMDKIAACIQEFAVQAAAGCDHVKKKADVSGWIIDVPIAVYLAEFTAALTNCAKCSNGKQIYNSEIFDIE